MSCCHDCPISTVHAVLGLPSAVSCIDIICPMSISAVHAVLGLPSTVYIICPMSCRHGLTYFSSACCLKPVLNWANVCLPEHTSDTSTNYDSFLNWTFSSPNMVRTVQTLLHSQLACDERQASARTCGRRTADSMIENVGWSQVKSSQYTLIIQHRVIQLTTVSFWVSETRLRLPQVNK